MIDIADEVEMTGAAAGLPIERQIQIALQEIVSRGGMATSEQVYQAVGRQMPAGTKLSQQGRDTVRSIIGRDAVDKGFIQRYDPKHPGWCVTLAGREYLASVQEMLGTEEEEKLPNEPENTGLVAESAITQPFDPATIRVDQRMMSIFQVMLKINREDIQLQPDFQRNLVWNQTRQSRLIESILLRIPLPAFYLDATHDDKWLVVDGLQRLSTLHKFYNQKTLTLTNLEFLSDLEGKRFEDLPRNLQRAIEDTELNLYVIRPETAPQVKFTIFSRVNTGGLVLTPQEIRHALFQGPATHFLAELASLEEFIQATTGSISSLRMDDRECVLRFLAFHLTDYRKYRSSIQRDRSGRVIPQSLDGFLSEAMQQLNKMDDGNLAALSDSFRRAMVNANAVFGEYAFRKLYQRNAKRTQISKPLFEVWSVLLELREHNALIRSRERIIDEFIELMGDIDFNKAISLGTGSIRSVEKRFSAVEQLLERTVK